MLMHLFDFSQIAFVLLVLLPVGIQSFKQLYKVQQKHSLDSGVYSRSNVVHGMQSFRKKKFLSSVKTLRLSTNNDINDGSNELTMTKVFFIESGFGCDQHGQNATKAAMRACRNAIEFNSLPAIRDIIPGGKQNMVLRVQIAVPDPHAVDHAAIATVFPYGILLPLEIKEGGMRASSGIALPELGDRNDQMYIAIAVVEVGY